MFYESLIILNISTLNFSEGVPASVIRDAINGKAGKAAALPKFSDTPNLSQPGRSEYAQPLPLTCPTKSVITPLIIID